MDKIIQPPGGVSAIDVIMFRSGIICEKVAQSRNLNLSFLGSKILGRAPRKILTDFVTHLTPYVTGKMLAWFPTDSKIKANLH